MQKMRILEVRPERFIVEKLKYPKWFKFLNPKWVVALFSDEMPAEFNSIEEAQQRYKKFMDAPKVVKEYELELDI